MGYVSRLMETGEEEAGGSAAPSTHRMSQSGGLSIPEICLGGSHQTNHAGCQTGEERQQHVSSYTLRHNQLAADVDAENLNYQLRQINTDECRRHRTISVIT
jgi:hypothetical protein